MTSLLRPRESAAGLTTGEGEWRPRGLRLPSNPPGDRSGKGHMENEAVSGGPGSPSDRVTNCGDAASGETPKSCQSCRQLGPAWSR